MSSWPTLRRWTLAACVAAVFAIVLVVLSLQAPGADAPPVKADAGEEETHSWPMFGGGVNRNMVNLADKNISATWSLKPGAEKNVKWSQALGTKAYGGPIISGGKIFVGTNNWLPRSPDVTGDKGILMCFKESTGEFLWQYILPPFRNRLFIVEDLFQGWLCCEYPVLHLGGTGWNGRPSRRGNAS